MAAYDLEEQEQLAEIKAWWKQNGNRLVNVATVVALLVLAWQGWNWYQRNQAGQASVIYSALQTAIQDKDSQRIKAASGELLEKFGGTAYAPLGAMAAAKAMIDAGDSQTAKAQLLWAAEHAKNELQDIARLRAATVLLDEKAHDQALKLLEGAVTPGFESRFQDMRGDILAAQGKKEEAISAYRGALEKLTQSEKTGEKDGPAKDWQGQASAISREILTQKLDALGGAK